ncbi:hypothetical protein ONJ45_26575, partial [Salmonella enterica subsp. enterica serovar Virginia]|nr:hypothetical protein [Salmonella enterica subsp. enterica serovar Virginia]
GNVVAQAEAFRGLGVEIKREINPDLAEQAVTQDEEYRLRSIPVLTLIVAFSPKLTVALVAYTACALAPFTVIVALLPSSVLEEDA